MLVKGFRHTQPAPHIEKQLQQRAAGLAGLPVLLQPCLQRLAELREGAVQRFVALRPEQSGFWVLLTLVAQLPQQFIHPVQGVFQGTAALAKRPLCGSEIAFHKAGAVHLSGPVRQIVGLVHQKQIVPLALKKTAQADHRVKRVVVIAYDYVAPEA